MFRARVVKRYLVSDSNGVLVSECERVSRFPRWFLRLPSWSGSAVLKRRERANKEYAAIKALLAVTSDTALQSALSRRLQSIERREGVGEFGTQDKESRPAILPGE